MTLADFTNERLIAPRLVGRDAPSALQELCHRLQCEKRIPDLLPFYHAALNREFMLGSDSGAGSGMVFPHARVPGLAGVSFALGRAAEPLDWGAVSSSSIRLVFLIAVPATDSTQYFSLLSGLSRLMKSPLLVERLHAVGDASGMLAVLAQIELLSGVTS